MWPLLSLALAAAPAAPGDPPWWSSSASARPYLGGALAQGLVGQRTGVPRLLVCAFKVPASHVPALLDLLTLGTLRTSWNLELFAEGAGQSLGGGGNGELVEALWVPEGAVAKVVVRPGDDWRALPSFEQGPVTVRSGGRVVRCGAVSPAGLERERATQWARLEAAMKDLEHPADASPEDVGPLLDRIAGALRGLRWLGDEARVAEGSARLLGHWRRFVEASYAMRARAAVTVARLDVSRQRLELRPRSGGCSPLECLAVLDVVGPPDLSLRFGRASPMAPHFSVRVLCEDGRKAYGSTWVRDEGPATPGREQLEVRWRPEPFDTFPWVGPRGLPPWTRCDRPLLELEASSAVKGADGGRDEAAALLSLSALDAPAPVQRGCVRAASALTEAP